MGARYEAALADRAAILASVPPAPRLRDIVAAVASAFEVPAPRMLSESRRPPIVRARHACVLLARQRTEQSYVQIARLLNRDHSTVQHSARVATRLELEDGDFAARLHQARKTLTEGTEA
jgi:chromosomal replication initiation ATPase DnaA